MAQWISANEQQRLRFRGSQRYVQRSLTQRSPMGRTLSVSRRARRVSPARSRCNAEPFKISMGLRYYRGADVRPTVHCCGCAGFDDAPPPQPRDPNKLLDRRPGRVFCLGRPASPLQIRTTKPSPASARPDLGPASSAPGAAAPGFLSFDHPRVNCGHVYIVLRPLRPCCSTK